MNTLQRRRHLHRGHAERLINKRVDFERFFHVVSRYERQMNVTELGRIPVDDFVSKRFSLTDLHATGFLFGSYVIIFNRVIVRTRIYTKAVEINYSIAAVNET